MEGMSYEGRVSLLLTDELERGYVSLQLRNFSLSCWRLLVSGHQYGQNRRDNSTNRWVTVGVKESFNIDEKFFFLNSYFIIFIILL